MERSTSVSEGSAARCYKAMQDEPSMTIEEALADPFGEFLVDIMHMMKVDRITRTEYLRFCYWDGVPDPWPGELEGHLPEGLQDEGMEIDPSLPRRSVPDV